MTLQQYQRLSAPLRAPKRRRLLIAANKALTGSVYAAFCLLCLGMLMQRDLRLPALLAVCGVPFVLLSWIRVRIDAPRPYEVWGIAPLIPKDTRGKSFPSRHVFSAFVIAAAIRSVCPPLSAAIAIAGALLSVVRVIGGVHFPRDVIAGAAAGIVCGAIGAAIAAI